MRAGQQLRRIRLWIGNKNTEKSLANSLQGSKQIRDVEVTTWTPKISLFFMIE